MLRWFWSSLLGSSALGLFIRPLLSERHRSREVIEFVQLVVAMLMTFAALVLGLLTSSVKSSFDKVGNDLRGLAVAADPARSIAARMGQPKPSRPANCCVLTRGGDRHDLDRRTETSGRLLSHRGADWAGSHLESSVMGDMLTQIELDIRQLEPHDPMHRRLATYLHRPIRASDADALATDRGGGQLDLDAVLCRAGVLARCRVRQLWTECAAQCSCPTPRSRSARCP